MMRTVMMTAAVVTVVLAAAVLAAAVEALWCSSCNSPCRWIAMRLMTVNWLSLMN